MGVFVRVFGEVDLPDTPCPGRLQFGHLPVDRAIGFVGPRQITAADQELLYDLPASEEEGLLEPFRPLF